MLKHRTTLRRQSLRVVNGTTTTTTTTRSVLWLKPTITMQRSCRLIPDDEATTHASAATSGGRGDSGGISPNDDDGEGNANHSNNGNT
jgi:hypothetical protein